MTTTHQTPIPSRRAVLAGAATVLTSTGIGAAGIIPTKGTESDPIFALIEAHRAALAAHLAAGGALSDSEERAVDEKMAAAGSPENGSTAWYEAIHAAERDPLYMDAEALLDKTSDAEIAAAWALVAEPPTTIAGAAALAAYASEYKSIIQLPDKPEEWLMALLASVHSTLSAEAVS